MKFVLTESYVYDWPVKALVPDPSKPGAMLEQELVVKFAAMSRDEAKRLDAEIAALPETEQVARQDDVLRRVLVGWEGVVDSEDRRVPFAQETLDIALQFPWFRSACYRAYADSLRGAVAGN